jgi:hypothetical protein
MEGVGLVIPFMGHNASYSFPAMAGPRGIVPDLDSRGLRHAWCRHRELVSKEIDRMHRCKSISVISEWFQACFGGLK